MLNNASMKNWSRSRTTLVAMALGFGSLVATTSPIAVGQDTNPPASSQLARTDAQLQADAQKQLSSAPGVSGQGLTATAHDGVVTITGSVPDEVTRQLAENAVSGVSGVKSVQNRLKVGDVPEESPAQTDAAVPAQDQAPPAQAEQAPSPAQAPPSNTQQGTNDGWGPAGPPPDAVNGQVPPPPAESGSGAPNPPSNPAPRPGTSYGPPPSVGGGYPAYPGDPRAQYPNGASPARPQYRSYQEGTQPPPAPQYVQPRGPVTIPAGSLVTVRLQGPIDGRHVQTGDTFIVNVARDVFQEGVLALPVGATLEGKVVAVKKPGSFAGGGFIQLQLTQLDLDGHSYPVASDIFSTATPGKGANSAANTIGGAAFGAILGAAIGGGSGAAIGAVAGGGTGAAISSATPGPRSFIPAEAMITFHLAGPLTIQPVSYQEATRLAATMPQPRPVLLPRRAYYPPPVGYYPYYRY